ncbi:MAG: glycosyltransferase family 2 protein [Winogradskyella sp.]
MKPLVSIIIPTYNRAHLIEGTLDAIIAQTYKNWECLIVDDGSTDKTKSLISHYTNKDERFRFFSRPEELPKGANACRNYGFQQCRGDLIQWFDSDDIMHPDLIRLKVEAFNNDVDIDFVICGITTINSLGAEKNYSIPKVSNYLEAFLMDKLILNTFNILWKRHAVKDVRWDTSILKYQDLDFTFRILYKNTLKGFSIDKCLITVKVHRQSISKINNEANNLSRLKVRERLCDLAKNTMSKQIQLRLYHLYLIEIRNILSLGDYKNSIKAIRSDVINTISVRTALYFFVFIHKFTRRGLVLLTKYIIKIST